MDNKTIQMACLILLFYTAVLSGAVGFILGRLY